MARVVSFAIPDDKQDVWEEFVKIAKREAKSVSQLLTKLVDEYVAKHSGNPVTPLDAWVERPSFALFPTLGEPPAMKKLKELPKHMLQELKNNAKEYYETAELLLSYLEKHDSMHKPFKMVEKYCPYCEQE